MLRLLPIDGAPAQKLIASHGFMKTVTIANETYKGLPAVTTLEVPILWTVAIRSILNWPTISPRHWPASPLAAGDKSPIDFALADTTGPLALHPGGAEVLRRAPRRERRVYELGPAASIRMT